MDTSSAAGSVALLEEGTLRAHASTPGPYAHAESLLPALDALLRESGLAIEAVDGFAVAAGPGSFTGLRIGISTMEGLAFATGRPIAGVSTLEATAFHYRDRSRLVAPFLDARRGEVYAALYRASDERLDVVVEPACLPPDAFLARLAGRDAETILIAGSGADLHRQAILRTLGPRTATAGAPSSLAEEVARLGERRLAAGQGAPLGTLRAVYLRPSDAERGDASGRERSVLP